MNAQRQLESLLDSIRLAALEADEQCDVLPHFVHITDEVRSLFDDAMLLFDQLKADGVVPPVVEPALRTLQNAMTSVARRPEVDPRVDLRTNPGWSLVRAAARDALTAFGQPLRRPTLAAISWVK